MFDFDFEEDTAGEDQENSEATEDENLDTDTDAEAEENSSDESEEDGEEATPEEKEAKAKKSKQSGFRKRLDKQRRKTHEAEKNAEYWKGKAEKNAAPEDSSTERTPQGVKPTEDQFDTHDEWIEALVDFKSDQKYKENQEKTNKETADAVELKQAQKWDRNKQNFAAKTPDFDDVIDDAEAQGLKFSNVVSQAMFDSNNGPAILYELAKNPEEVERLNGLGMYAAIREIGKIEGRVAPTKKTKTKTTAPAPITSTKGSGKVSKDIYSKDISFSEFEAQREKDLAKKAS